jgi:hypothetical protein
LVSEKTHERPKLGFGGVIVLRGIYSVGRTLGAEEEAQTIIRDEVWMIRFNATRALHLKVVSDFVLFRNLARNTNIHGVDASFAIVLWTTEEAQMDRLMKSAAKERARHVPSPYTPVQFTMASFAFRTLFLCLEAFGDFTSIPIP